LDSCPDTGHGSLRYLSDQHLFQKLESTPHLSPLPFCKGRGGKPCVAFQCKTAVGRNRRNSGRVPTLMTISESFVRPPTARKSSASVPLVGTWVASPEHALRS
jgi:hypothetical protein